MKRKEQMMALARSAELNSRTIDLSKKKVFMSAYIQGWKDADSNPQWIPVEERLPEKDNEFEDYSKFVVVTDGKDFYKGMYNYGWECWLTHDLWPIEDVIYWMEVQLPQPPRKEDNDENPHRHS